MGPESRQCQSCKSQFTIEPEDFDFYKRLTVLPPTTCPLCRFKQRCVFRNERTLYNRSCDLCGKKIISMYHPDGPYTVYCPPCYVSDAWDPFSYALEYDEKRSFLSQFKELVFKVPKMALYQTGYGTNVNSEYTNFAGPYDKNCYLFFNGGNCEDCLYTRGLRYAKNSVDAYYGSNIENCYEVINAEKSFGVRWGQNIVGSLDSTLLLSCNNCQNCFGCVNLRSKKYCFFNEQLTAEEYARRVGEVQGSFRAMEEMRERFEMFSLQFPRRENNNFKAFGSMGDYLFESKNLSYCFEVAESENCKYCFFSKQTKDCYDITGYGYGSELLLGAAACGISARVIGSVNVSTSHDIEYGMSLTNCGYCIGCDGLKNAKHCILNARYAEEDFKKLRERIIAELTGEGTYGSFLPVEFSPFGYNETIAYENAPLTKEQALAEGFRWEDNVQTTRGKETIEPDKIPDYIGDVPDSITEEVLTCVNCSRNYKIVRDEFRFYRASTIPIPRRCFYCRHADRVRRRGPVAFYERVCSRCGKAIVTNFASNRPEIIYCEQCYNSEVA
jgi:hypothetical protein